MKKTDKCIIDNWSMEHAGILLDCETELPANSRDQFIKNIGGLSNFITAILLYTKPYFPLNGFEKDWKRLKWFDSKIIGSINGIETAELGIKWSSAASYRDRGVKNYLVTSRYFESDLIIAPERAAPIIVNKIPKVNKPFLELLNQIDEEIQKEKKDVLFSNLEIGLKKNFSVPSLTQYVLSETDSRNDLLTVILQLRDSKKIKKIVEKINEISLSVTEAGKLQREIDNIIKEGFGRPTSQNKDWSIGLSALFLSIGKNFDLSFFRRSQYIVFLRNLINCRMEAHKLDKDIQRVFKRKLFS